MPGTPPARPAACVIAGIAIWVMSSFFPSAVAQQPLYKVRLKDGTVQYTDRVPPGATLLEKIEPRPGGSALSPLPPPAARIDELDARMRHRQKELEAAQQEVVEAERAVEQARRALQAGRSPQPGELLGIRGGGLRTTPEYDARIAALEAALAAAEERARRAYEARNDLR